MKRLIVTADDFGLTEKVNEAIVEGHRHGIVTSTSLMANGGAFEHAVELARETPSLGIGAHLNLTEGSPVAPAAEVQSLLNGSGNLRGGPMGLGKRIVAGTTNLSHIERELRAQIEKILAAGVKLTHIDGHKHVQLLPRVFELVVRLATEYEIKGVRCATERVPEPLALWRRNRASGDRLLKQFAIGRGLSLMVSRMRAKAKRAGLKTPRHFFGIAQTGFLDTATLNTILRSLPEGTSELMCHPGYVDDALERTPTRLLKQRETELQALIEPETRDLMAKYSIELITYRELNEES
jgi:hopanoid biosynthesis associated protein HpnK